MAQSPKLAALAALALCAAACHGPLLWIGELPDASTDKHEPGKSRHEDAGAPAADSGTQTSDASMPTEPPAKPHDPRVGTTGASVTPGSQRDAGSGAHDLDADAGIDPLPPDLPMPTQLPAVRGRCPELTRSGTYTFGDPRVRTLSVDIYIDPDVHERIGPGAPLVLYYHAIGSGPSEVTTAIGKQTIDTVMRWGGVVAAFSAKLCATCGLSDELQWYPEDDAVTDQVVACSLAQAHIDTRRIHAVGFSAGAMYSLRLALTRSNYIASVVSYSGGQTDANPPQPTDPTNRVPAFLTFGRAGLDFIGLDFPMLAREWHDKYGALGYYSLLCDHGGGHVISEELVPFALRFVVDHAYKVQPEPYVVGGVPADFPSSCTDMPKPR